jgi:hypothetical protein
MATTPQLIFHSRAIYGRVTEDDIESYKLKYRFCDAEKEDLLEFYSNHGGDLTNILEFIPYSDDHDLERYVCWFSLQIQADAIECTKKFKPLFKSDVNAEQQQQLWEQGRAALEKVPSWSLFTQHKFLIRMIRNNRNARLPVEMNLEKIALLLHYKAELCSASRASMRCLRSEHPASPP